MPACEGGVKHEPLSLDKYLKSVSAAAVHAPSGVVVEVVGLVVEVGGLQAGVGDILEVYTESDRSLDLEVIGFRSGRLLATPLGSITGVRPGARVVRSERGSSVDVGETLLGRVIDAFGNPLDERPAAQVVERYPVHAPPPAPFARRPIVDAFGTGIRAIDGLLTLGCGQRVGIYAGAGVGKSTLLGMICRSSQADVNVIALIGERGREVNDFVRAALGPEGLRRSVVVAATSDQPPLVRARGAETATAIAEFLRDQGRSVLLVMDSLTRYAMALREAALASGEPPATKGYPPSVFAALPRLLERAGTGNGVGVITAFYTVLVEGDDLADPVADATRSTLDGHIVLARSLAERGHYPAIDVLQSVSRLAPAVTDPEQLRVASSVREILSTYREAVDLIQVGAYVPGTDPRVDMAARCMPAVDAFLRQGIPERTPMAETRARMREIAASAASGPGS
jgi:FliI/YscN family ATPase